MPPTLTLGDQSWTLQRGTTTIGRQDTCDIVIPDRSLSRAHASLEVSRDKIIVSDNQSSNGTFINNDRISVENLKDGDLLRLGSISLQFAWPESVVNVSANPISKEQAQQIKEKLATKSEVKVDWKTSLASTAAIGAVATGIIAGLVGALMGENAILPAVMVGAVGGIATSLMVRSITQQRVSGTLSGLKDDLDLYYNNQNDDVDIPGGFPELTDVVHTIRLGTEVVKDRVANQWRMKLHEAQMALQAAEALQDTVSGDRGFTQPMLALDSQFRITGWNAASRALLRPGLERIEGAHLLEAMHDQTLGSRLINALTTVGEGGVQAHPNFLQSHSSEQLTLLVSRPPQGPQSHAFILQFIDS